MAYIVLDNLRYFSTSVQCGGETLETDFFTPPLPPPSPCSAQDAERDSRFYDALRIYCRRKPEVRWGCTDAGSGETGTNTAAKPQSYMCARKSLETGAPTTTDVTTPLGIRMYVMSNANSKIIFSFGSGGVWGRSKFNTTSARRKLYGQNLRTHQIHQIINSYRLRRLNDKNQH